MSLEIISTVNLAIHSNFFHFLKKKEIYIKNDSLKWTLGSAVIVPSARKKVRGFRATPTGFDFWHCQDGKEDTDGHVNGVYGA